MLGNKVNCKVLLHDTVHTRQPVSPCREHIRQQSMLKQCWATKSIVKFFCMVPIHTKQPASLQGTYKATVNVKAMLGNKVNCKVLLYSTDTYKITSLPAGNIKAHRIHHISNSHMISLSVIPFFVFSKTSIEIDILNI